MTIAKFNLNAGILINSINNEKNRDQRESKIRTLSYDIAECKMGSCIPDYLNAMTSDESKKYFKFCVSQLGYPC